MVQVQFKGKAKRMAKEVRVNRVALVVLVALGVAVSLFVIYKVTSSRQNSMEFVKISELISASIDLAERGGRRVVEVRKMGDKEIGQLSKGLTKEGKKEYVTVGDKVNSHLCPLAR